MAEITKEHAERVKELLRSTDGWDELAECFPFFAKAVDEMPDDSSLLLCNPMLRDIMADAIKRTAQKGKEQDFSVKKVI